MLYLSTIKVLLFVVYASNTGLCSQSADATENQARGRRLAISLPRRAAMAPNSVHSVNSKGVSPTHFAILLKMRLTDQSMYVVKTVPPNLAPVY